MMGRGFVKGEYVWSKAFGEVVAHEIDLPEVTPEQYLADYQDAQLFDVRPTAEYQDFTLPKSQSLPNSLLLANVQALKDTGKMSLLHCAGRTRSIIGAFTLMASGFDGPFAVFRGGTQAWQLDGYEREHDANRLFAADHEASDAVAGFLRRWQIPATRVKASDGLGAFVADHKTELLFDVSDDGATGQPLAHGVIKISGTNLIQQTDRSIARYHVPVVLFDQGSGSRAAFAAFWLRCMGFSVTMACLEAPIAALRKPSQTPSPKSYSQHQCKQQCQFGHAFCRDPAGYLAERTKLRSMISGRQKPSFRVISPTAIGRISVPFWLERRQINQLPSSPTGLNRAV